MDQATQEPAQLPQASAELLVLQPTAGQKPELRFPTATQEPVQMSPLVAAEPQLNQATQEPAQLPLASAELLVLQPTVVQKPELRVPTAAQEPVRMFPLVAAEPQLNPYQQEPAQQPKTLSDQIEACAASKHIQSRADCNDRN